MSRARSGAGAGAGAGAERITIERPQAHIFLDESGTSSHGDILMVGATAFSDAIRAEQTIQRTYSRILGDATLWPDSRRRERFAARGFHFTDDSESVRDQLLSTLGTLDFRSYAAFAREPMAGSVSDTLIAMYGTLLRSVLARYKQHNLTVVFEQSSEMDAVYGKLWHVLQRTVDGLAHAEAFRGSKASPCLAATDYMLGVTRAHLQEGAKPFEQSRFKALGRTYAYLIDFDRDLHLGGTRRPIV